MEISLGKYSGMKICVAVSGGKDSMALLHYIYVHGAKFGIELSALNCDHGIRKVSASDSAFVKSWCVSRKIPLLTFAENCVALAKKRGVSVETAAREWRHGCYLRATQKHCIAGWEGADAVATAHQLDDNAETVLFNLARGSAISGVCGITDCVMRVMAEGGVKEVKLIRPMIEVPRAEIEAYIGVNHIEFVEDETNFTDDYTRNRIRHNVLPELEKAVPSAAKSIFSFSRLAAEDEEYFERQASKLLSRDGFGDVLIKACDERAVFSRAAVKAVKGEFARKDYTREIIDGLYALQYAQTGKKFEFLGLTAYTEEGQIAVCESGSAEFAERPFSYGEIKFCGGAFLILQSDMAPEGGALRFDCGKIPPSAVIRKRRAGDRITAFGGVSKSLGDYFTDKKIPLRLRDRLPVIADGNRVLAVCGADISEDIKITEKTVETGYIILN